MIDVAISRGGDITDEDGKFLEKLSTLPAGEVITLTDDEMDAAMTFTGGEKK
jgi:hypothetical protein